MEYSLIGVHLKFVFPEVDEGLAHKNEADGNRQVVNRDVVRLWHVEVGVAHSNESDEAGGG